MRSRPVRRRRSAVNDAAEAVIYYAQEAGLNVADRFIAALEAGYRAIGRRPGAGSPRYGALLDISDLRSRSVRRFPYLIFYMEHSDHVEVVRVLHARSDIISTLSKE